MTTEDLVLWLPEQIAAEETECRLALASPRRNGKATARQRLAQVEAHKAILGLHFVDSGGREVCNECNDPVPCGTVRAVALAHQHRPGYRKEWRP